MSLNPYIEILARALYNKNTSPIDIPFEDERLAIDAVAFMNCRTYVGRFSYGSTRITLTLNEN